jgi:hypothetical protein
MRLASISTSVASPTSAISRNIPTRRSLFSRLLEALHHSRRLQARRVLAQYRDLIGRYQPSDMTSKARGETDVGH